MEGVPSQIVWAQVPSLLVTSFALTASNSDLVALKIGGGPWSKDESKELRRLF